MSLPIYSSELMQSWDKFTIKNEPITSIDLMERAATNATSHIISSIDFEETSIFCGPGNNGGDGLVIARQLHLSSKKVTLYLLDFGNQTTDFKANLKRLPNTIKIVHLTDLKHSLNVETDLIIDCIFGSGLNKPVTGWIGNVINQINAIDAHKLAIDIPSGLFSDQNPVSLEGSSIFEAEITISFMAPKMSFLMSEYADFVGKFIIVDIGLSEKFNDTPIANYLTHSDIELKSKNIHDYKLNNGCILIIGGLENMSGAAVLSSQAAMRSGAGYVFSACSEFGKNALLASMPEIIWQSPHELTLNSKVNTIAIGPGLGKSELAINLLKNSLSYRLPMVLDADAIRILSDRSEFLDQLHPNCILTPHVGELKSLIGDFDNAELALKAQQEFSINHKVFIIQKGAYSKLSTPTGEIFVNSTGNPGMATAGMGDVLTGIIGSLLAQGYPSFEAAKIGMYMHGYAGDKVARENGQIGLTASDIIKALPSSFKDFSKS